MRLSLSPSWSRRRRSTAGTRLDPRLRFRPQLEQLEDRTAPSITVVGAGPGAAPTVDVLDASGKVLTTFNAFPQSFTGGVHVAQGDLNGDGVDDIVVSAGPGGSPEVNVYDGRTFQPITAFYAFNPTFTGGVNVTVGSIDPDGHLDIVCGAEAGGGPQVTVFDGKTFAPVESFYGLTPSFTGGVNVEVVDLNADGNGVIVVGAGPGGGPQVTGFNATTLQPVFNFYAEPATFTGGVDVASGDLYGDGFDELITGAGPGGLPQVNVYGGTASHLQLVSSFFAFSGTGSSGVNVSTVNLGLQADSSIPDGIAVTHEEGTGESVSTLETLQVFDSTGHMLSQSSVPLDPVIADDAATTYQAYTGPIWHGIDYSPTWPGWSQGAGGTQTNDTDFANDAFASFWANQYQAPPAGDTSTPANNGSNYRNDLGTIAADGFNLVRLYNWDPARGTATGSNAATTIGLDHINFLNYANSLGLKVVVPVGDYFLSSLPSAWDTGSAPDANYSFGSVPVSIQNDFNQFIAGITDPATGKISTAIQSIDVGNEANIGEGLNQGVDTASQVLARTNWWIVNLHRQINGSGPNGPNGNPVVNGASGTIIPLSSTFSDGGGNASRWYQFLLNGTTAGEAIPPGSSSTIGNTFITPVTGLSVADPDYASYYYNSINIARENPVNLTNDLAGYLSAYDSGSLGMKFNVPLLMMEVFTTDRGTLIGPAGNQYPFSEPNQIQDAVNQATTLETYLADNHAGTPQSTSSLEGFNYFQFNDEPSHGGKATGLFDYGSSFTNAHTGSTAVFYGGFNDFTFPVYSLVSAQNTNGTLAAQLMAIIKKGP